MVRRTSQPFSGDRTASPRGWVSDNQTKGNNVIAGTNVNGVLLLIDPRLVGAPDLNFEFPLELGRGTLDPQGSRGRGHQPVLLGEPGPRLFYESRL